MGVINQLANTSFYAPLSSVSVATTTKERVSADTIAAAAGNGISHNNPSQYIVASPRPIDWNQIANEGDADKLQQADALVADAYGLVGGRSASLIDHLRAQFEMAEASAIRQSVAKDLETRYPDYGLGAGGSLYAEQIREADAEEQQGFQLVQSPNLADVSSGATDLWAGSGLFSLIENNLRG